MSMVCCTELSAVKVRRFVQDVPPFVDTSTYALSVVEEMLLKLCRNFRLRGVAGIWKLGVRSSVLKPGEELPAMSESASAEKPVPPVLFARPHWSLRFQRLPGPEPLFTTVQPSGGKAPSNCSLIPPTRVQAYAGLPEAARSVKL